MQFQSNGQARLLMATIHSPIEKTAGVCGGKARISGTRIPVWGLENGRRLGLSVSEILERYPAISKDDLDAAWKYADAHKSEIDAEIEENQGC